VIDVTPLVSPNAPPRQVRMEMRDLLDFASAPARLSACAAQLQGHHPLEPGVAFTNLVGLLRRDLANVTVGGAGWVRSKGCRAAERRRWGKRGAARRWLSQTLRTGRTMTHSDAAAAERGASSGRHSRGRVANRPNPGSEVFH
jgi:hypothetical protein